MELARIGDKATGICRAHKRPRNVTGILSQGSSTCFVDGKGAVRVGDSVTFDCGHTGIVASGSSSFVIEGKGMARVGDSVIGPMTAVIVSGSPSTDSD